MCEKLYLMVIISLFLPLLATFINYGEARSLTTGVNAKMVNQSIRKITKKCQNIFNFFFIKKSFNGSK